MSEPYEVFAFRYGRLLTTWEEIYLDECGHGSSATEMAYYFWLASNSQRKVLIDTGFDPVVGTRRGRETLVPPVDLLKSAGIRPDEITDVVLTHFHYDHIGNARDFTNAQFYAADAEYAYWIREDNNDEHSPVEDEELRVLRGLRRDGRLTLLEDGARTPLVDGITAISLPGHTPGQLGVRISTDGRDVILTSDAAHSAAEIELDDPFRVFTNLDDMKASMATVRDLPLGPGLPVVALGHEPSVAEQFPQWLNHKNIFRLSAEKGSRNVARSANEI